MVAAFGGTAFAAGGDNAGDRGSSASAPGQLKKTAGSDPSTAAVVTHPAGFIGPVAPTSGSNANTTAVPFSNQGGVTTGSNTTAYEVANGRSGSPAVGGGQPSGDVKAVQPYSTADRNNTGANDTSASNPYRSTRDGAPSLNGNGGGKQVGQPCAGCVGKADNKNPKGQAPNATDHNAGYECDRNHGIGRSNPAHTGCKTTTPPTCVPTVANHHCGTDVPDCKGVVGGHATAADCNPGKDCKGVVGGHATAADCNPAKDCKGVVGGHATAADCNPAKDCKGVVGGHATAADCNPAKDCKGVVGGSATAADCGSGGGGGGIGGGTGNPATGPVTTPVTGRTVKPATKITPAAGGNQAAGTALPFTGSNTVLFLKVSALLLLTGFGLTLATRKPRPRLARV